MNDPNPQNRRRSQRVLLQIALLVKAELENGKRVQVQAFTLSVNAHGGLMETPCKLTAGQPITLVNPQTGFEAACRVVRVEESSESCFATAFEFATTSPRFWPIAFPPPDWGVTSELVGENV